MKLVFLIFSFVVAHSQISLAVMDKSKVFNTCDVSWISKDGVSFLSADISVVVDLTDSENKVEQTDYFRIGCRGKMNSKYKIVGTQCSGMKMNLSHPLNDKLHPVNTDVFYPEQFDIVTSPKDASVGLSWKDGITYNIVDGKSFTWSMKSVLSGKTFSGIASCKK